MMGTNAVTGVAIESRAASFDPASNTIFPATTIDGWAFDLEALYIARLHGLRIEEIPIDVVFIGVGRLGDLTTARAR